MGERSWDILIIQDNIKGLFDGNVNRGYILTINQRQDLLKVQFQGAIK